VSRNPERQISRLLALEDAIDVAGRAPELIRPIRTVGDQAATGDEEAGGVNRGQAVMGRQRGNQLAMDRRKGAPRHDQAAIRPTRECSNRALDLARLARADEVIE
jgi:hypothetical protein